KEISLEDTNEWLQADSTEDTWRHLTDEEIIAVAQGYPIQDDGDTELHENENDGNNNYDVSQGFRKGTCVSDKSEIKGILCRYSQYKKKIGNQGLVTLLAILIVPDTYSNDLDTLGQGNDGHDYEMQDILGRNHEMDLCTLVTPAGISASEEGKHPRAPRPCETATYGRKRIGVLAHKKCEKHEKLLRNSNFVRIGWGLYLFEMKKLIAGNGRLEYKVEVIKNEKKNLKTYFDIKEIKLNAFHHGKYEKFSLTSDLEIRQHLQGAQNKRLNLNKTFARSGLLGRGCPKLSKNIEAIPPFICVLKQYAMELWGFVRQMRLYQSGDAEHLAAWRYSDVMNCDTKDDFPTAGPPSMSTLYGMGPGALVEDSLEDAKLHDAEHKAFAEGREDVNDENRAGRPSTSRSDNNVKRSSNCASVIG
ncbi:hypothetical protein NQ318_022882, partial [Aromia moschata]